jgi:hypothetical protein
MGLNKQFDQYIEYINILCCKSLPLDPQFRYSIYKIKDIEIMKKMFSQVNEELTTLEAVNEHENNQGGFTPYNKTITLSSKILIKQNVSIKLYARNYNIEYGIVSDVDETLKTCAMKTKDLDVV